MPFGKEIDGDNKVVTILNFGYYISTCEYLG